MNTLNRAIVFTYEHYVPTEQLRMHIQILKQEAEKHEGRQDLYPVVMHIAMDAEGKITYFLNTTLMLPYDIFQLRPVWDQMQENSETGDQPALMTFEKNLDISNEKKPKPRAVSRKTDPQVAFDPALLPEHLAYVGTQAFREQAEDIYKAMSFVPLNIQLSDGPWIKKRFVDNMEKNWPLIARLDSDLEGAISDVFLKISVTPNFPPWWKSIGVTLLNGNPDAAVRVSRDVVAYNKSNGQFSDIDTSDRYTNAAASVDGCMLDDIE